MNEEILTPEEYPSVSARVKAIVADSFVLIIFMAIATSVFKQLGNVSDSYRIITMLFIVLL